MTISIVRDMRSRYGPARNQGTRPTCLAFAASDTHAAARGAWFPLSCEFVFYHAQRRGNRSPHEGALLSLVLQALKEDGQPAENGWPYLSSLPAALSSWKPPASVGPVYRRLGEIATSSVEEIVRVLEEDRPALIVSMLSDSFYLPGPDGVIDSVPGDGPDPTRRHAVVAVGHGKRNGERLILVRNSWGEEWGIGGYGWLTESFLRPRLTRVAVLTTEV